MHRVIVLVLLCSLGAVASAQDQERKLLDRLMRPNMNLSNPVQNKSFYGGKEFQSGSKNSQLKEFRYIDRTRTKQFRTRSFASTPFWGGDARYATTKANTGGTPRDAGKTYGTRNAETKDAFESGKGAPVRDYADQKPFAGRGTAQGTLDKEHEKGPKTMDEVRELLNKNK